MGGGLWAFIMSRDKDIIHLKEDEIVVKKPSPEFVLIQVTPDIARRLVYYEGKLEPKNTSEARSMYPERVWQKNGLNPGLSSPSLDIFGDDK